MSRIKEESIKLVESHDRQAILVHLERFQGVPTGELAFLHYVRSGRATDDMLESYRTLYNKGENGRIKTYTAWAENKHIDLVVSVPSSRNDAVHVKQAILTSNSNAMDASSSVVKEQGKKAGAAKSYNEVLAIMTLVESFDLTSYHNVVILDDIYNTGRSVSAVIQRLVEQGLPSDAKIYVCAPLWMVPQK